MRGRRSAVLTAALTVLSVGALLCCGAAAADEPGAGLRAAETTAVYSAASGLSATSPIQSEPSAVASAYYKRTRLPFFSLFRFSIFGDEDDSESLGYYGGGCTLRRAVAR